MKKFILTITLIIILCNVLCTAAFSEAADTVALSSATVQPGKTAEIIVSLSKSVNLVSLQLEIEYDKNVMSMFEVTDLSGNSSFLSKLHAFDKNPYNFGWFSQSELVFSDNIFSVKFNISEAAVPGKYPVKINFFKGRDGNASTSNGAIFDKNEAPVYLNYLSSFITVTDDTTKAAPAEYSLCLDSQNIALGGRLVAALYNNDGQLVESKFYDAEETVDISFSQKGDYIKLMQWNMDGLVPLTDFHRIEVK